VVPHQAAELREGGGQLFHPTFRLAVAVDEIIAASGDKPKRR
jgi:hypothetical protein